MNCFVSKSYPEEEGELFFKGYALDELGHILKNGSPKTSNACIFLM